MMMKKCVSANACSSFTFTVVIDNCYLQIDREPISDY